MCHYYCESNYTLMDVGDLWVVFVHNCFNIMPDDTSSKTCPVICWLFWWKSKTKSQSDSNDINHNNIHGLLSKCLLLILYPACRVHPKNYVPRSCIAGLCSDLVQVHFRHIFQVCLTGCGLDRMPSLGQASWGRQSRGDPAERKGLLHRLAVGNHATAPVPGK